MFNDAYGSDALNQFAIAYNGLYTNAVGALGSALPIGVNGIGFPILPILAGGSSLLSTFLNPQQQAQPAGEQQQMNPKTMGIFMAAFSVFICWTNSAAFSLYWLTSNLIATANNLVINKIIDYKEKKQKAKASVDDKQQ